MTNKLFVPEHLGEAAAKAATAAEKMNFPETPPAPLGWLKVFPSKDAGIAYIRKSDIHMIILHPEDVVLVTADGVSAPKLEVMICGFIGDRPVNTVVDMKAEDVLAELAEG